MMVENGCPTANGRSLFANRWHRRFLRSIWRVPGCSRLSVVRGQESNRLLTKRTASSESLRDRRQMARQSGFGAGDHSLRNPGESPVSRSVGHSAQILRCLGVNLK